MYIDKNNTLYQGDMAIGDREATGTIIIRRIM